MAEHCLVSYHTDSGCERCKNINSAPAGPLNLWSISATSGHDYEFYQFHNSATLNLSERNLIVARVEAQGVN
jgi:hypothetical protein